MSELSGIHQRTQELLQLWDETTKRLSTVFAPSMTPTMRMSVSKVPGILRPVVGIFLTQLVKAKRHYYGESEEL